jgi:hypothetical protein
MTDGPDLHLVPYVDDRGFEARFCIPEHVKRRRARIVKLVNAFRGLEQEFSTHEEEYQFSTADLTRQDINDMVRYLLSEIAITEHTNRRMIRKLKALHPEKIWSGQ